MLEQFNQLLVDKNSRLTSPGVYSSAIEGVYLLHQTQCSQTEPTLYDSGMIFVLSGLKCAQLGERSYQYDVDHALILTSSYPVLCSSKASQQQPLQAVFINFSRIQVMNLLKQIQSMAEPGALTQPLPADSQCSLQAKSVGIHSCSVTPAIDQALLNLLHTLQDPIAAKLFGSDQIRALLYAVLQSSSGFIALSEWVKDSGSYAQFQKAIDYIQAHISQAIVLSDLAAHAGLSESSLNRVFKRYAADTPMQYIKKLRLNRARYRLDRSDCSVQEAAHDVAYESVSQFSREFKRYFGHSPKDRGRTKN